MPPVTRPRLLSYGLAVLTVALVVLPKLLLDPLIGTTTPSLLLLAAVMVSAWYGGLWPGLVTVVLSVVAVAFFSLTPQSPPEAGTGSLADYLRVTLFLLEGVLIVWLVESLHAARRQADDLAQTKREALSREERATAEAQAAGQRYRDLVNGLDAIVWEADADTLWVQFVNRRAEAILGYPVQRWLSEPNFWMNLIHPDDRQRAVQLCRSAAAEGRDLDFEYRAVAADGRVVWLRDLVYVVRDPGGRVRHLRGLMVDVTERRRIEDEMRQSEKNLADFFENSAMGLHWVAPDGRILRANQAELDLLGYSRQEYVGHPIAEFHADPEVLDDILRRLQAGETLHNYEARLRCKDGSFKHVLIDSNVLWEHGRFVHSRCFTRDITDRKQAEDALQASEERYRRIAETANEGIWLIDTDARTTFINQRMAEMLGCPIEGMVGRTVHEFVFAEDRPLVRERIGQNLRGVPEQFDFRFRRADGTAVLVLCCTSPVTDAQGKIIGALGMFSDITARKRAEETLRESEERFRLMADTVPSCVWTAMPDGSVNYANERWYAYSGLTAEQTAGLGWADALHPEDRERCLAAWKRATEEGTFYEIEARYRGADGQYHWFLTRASPLRDARGTVTGWFGTATDIHAQKQAEEALKVADRRKDEFLATLSHELRNPLAALRNALHILRTSDPDDPDAIEARDVIERQAQLLGGLVDDLLDVFRITHHKIKLKYEPLDLVRLVRLTVEDHRSALEGSRLVLTLDLPKKPVWVMGDRTRLSQILSNLVQNAAKFTNAGGHVHVEVAADRSPPRALVTVRDTGVGIAPQVLPHVFETFIQAEQSMDRSHGGLGLGLALVRGLVELHGGGVKATSAGLGHGAAFTFWLPRGEKPKAPAKAPPLPVVAARRLRILIVEDNRDTAKTLRTLLLRYGHEVALAHSGPTGVATAREWRPDVVLCDLGLPEMDGYEVARALRAQPATASVRLIAVSGYGQEDDRRRSDQAGFDLHLTKPVDPADLQRLLAVLKVGS